MLFLIFLFSILLISTISTDKNNDDDEQSRETLWCREILQITLDNVNKKLLNLLKHCPLTFKGLSRI